MSRRARLPIVSAGIIELHDNRILIVCDADDHDPSRRWRFPRGIAAASESPETAMRRIARNDLGLTVEIVVGQPPIPGNVDDQPVELRYFFCGVSDGELTPRPRITGRWVSKAHLREYAFDAPSQPVVAWLLEP
jgi:ADP-ribose pyrophosphatase YjhB (NUDIX family)